MSDKINIYLSGYQKMKDALASFPDELIDWKPAKNKWSIREILVHLADSETNGFVRVRLAIAQNGLSITPYDQDIWSEKLYYKEQSIEDTMELFRLLRKTTYDLLVKLPEEKWNNYYMHPERGKETVEDWLRIFHDHVDTHVRRMNRNFEEWKKEKENSL